LTQPFFASFDAAALAARIGRSCASGDALLLDAADCPPDLESAEDVLWRVTRGDGRKVVAWKLGASTFVSRAAQGFDRAWSAPLFEGEVLESPARLPAREDGTLGLECELVFRLGADVPDAGPLDPATVRRLVAGVRAGIEVPASRYPALGAYGAPALVADRGAAGWLVVGDELAGWEPDDLDTIAARLMVDGVERGAGSGRDIIEGPFGALCEHLARMRRHGVAQPAGMVVSIGSLTGYVVVTAPCTAAAEFVGVGGGTLVVSIPGT
jgi:2-keto-4-pentenoate hydratase